MLEMHSKLLNNSLLANLVIVLDSYSMTVLNTVYTLACDVLSDFKYSVL